MTNPGFPLTNRDGEPWHSATPKRTLPPLKRTGVFYDAEQAQIESERAFRAESRAFKTAILVGLVLASFCAVAFYGAAA